MLAAPQWQWEIAVKTEVVRKSSREDWLILAAGSSCGETLPKYFKKLFSKRKNLLANKWSSSWNGPWLKAYPITCTLFAHWRHPWLKHMPAEPVQTTMRKIYICGPALLHCMFPNPASLRPNPVMPCSKKMREAEDLMSVSPNISRWSAHCVLFRRQPGIGCKVLIPHSLFGLYIPNLHS